ncbi:MAG: T9SS type A sorting domain-containing protein [Spirochaetes bacterium]|nr:T9SS type A sorting domain-containing protein [Spirochaetota bacterium]
MNKYHKLLAIFLFILVTGFTSLYSQAVVVWTQRYSAFAICRSYGIDVDSSHNAYVCGRQKLTAASSNGFFTAKVNADSSFAWIRTYNVTNTNNAANGIAVDNIGNVIVAGQKNIGNIGAGIDTDFLTISYDQNGNTNWIRAYDGGGGGSGVQGAWGVVVDSANNVYTCGLYHNGASMDGLTLSYGSDGSTNWIMSYDTGNGTNEGCLAVAKDQNNNRYFLGAKELTGGASDYALFSMKYDSSSNVVWAKRDDNVLILNAHIIEPASITVDYSGNVYFGLRENYTHPVYGAGKERAFIMKKDMNGNTLRTQTFELPGATPTNCGIHGVGVDSFNNFYICGYTFFSNQTYAYIAKYDPDGNIIWSNSSIQGRAFDISIDNEHSLYLACQNNNDLLVVKMHQKPYTPTLISARGSLGGAIELTWQDVVNDNGYNIYKSSDGVAYNLIGSAAKNSTTYQDTTSESGKAYYYRIAAVNNAGESDGSNVVQVSGSVSTEAVAYPTVLPHGGTVYFYYVGAASDIKIYNSLGEMVKELKAVEADQWTPSSDIASGFYIAVFKDQRGEEKQVKFIYGVKR